jgi:pimeloyl-ACP methyl ester carboxylesterase
MEFREIENGEIVLRVALSGHGPVILCVHGWPELWYSWRHQLRHFAERGYTVAAMDVRGYGGSSKPHAIEAYRMTELCADVAAVARELSDEPVVLFGHDWGAPIVWNTALRHPESVRAVAGLSVPYLPAGDVGTLDLFRGIYAGRFFYQLYFQEEGVVEAEVEGDFETALRKIYFSLSGDAPLDDWLKNKPADASLLDGMVDPRPFPEWMSEEDLGVYVDAFTAGGFRGPINRYRAQNLDVAESGPLRGLPVDTRIRALRAPISADRRSSPVPGIGFSRRHRRRRTRLCSVSWMDCESEAFSVARPTAMSVVPTRWMCWRTSQRSDCREPMSGWSLMCNSSA